MRLVTRLFCLLAVGVCSGRGNAEENSCAHCGQPGACKTCRLVLKDRKIEVVCWGIKRDPICVPGCSKPGCKHCEKVCAGDSTGEVCHRSQLLKWIEWRPASSAKIYTKNKLMKKVEIRKVPAYEWVLEDLCPRCQACCENVARDPHANIPRPPASAARTPEAPPAADR